MRCSLRPTCIVLLLFVFNLVACAEWTQIKSPELRNHEGRYRVALPVCWVRASYLTDKMGISKDGPLLNWIEIKYSQKEESLPLTRVKINDDMLVSEVAEYVLAELKTKYQKVTLNHIKTEPAMISGKSGFKIHVETTNAKGLEYELIVYGFVDGPYLYQLSYNAPRLYYFEKDLQTFEDVVASFSMRP